MAKVSQRSVFLTGTAIETTSITPPAAGLEAVDDDIDAHEVGVFAVYHPGGDSSARAIVANGPIGEFGNRR